MLEIRHFRLIDAIARSGSLAAASVRLNLTASALSHQLRDAEEKLGVQLFVRRHRRLIATPAGDALLESARRVLAATSDAEARLQRGAPDDLLRISTGCYTAYAWLPHVLDEWQPRHPRVELRVVLEATRNPLPALLSGQLDVALTTDDVTQPRFARTFLFSDELVLLVPRTHPFAKRRSVSASEVAGEHILAYDAPREQLDIFTRVFWPAGVEPRRVSRVPLTEAIVDLVRSGIGVAPLADWVLPDDRDGLARVRLSTKGLRRKWHAVTLVTHRRSPAIVDFIQTLRRILISGWRRTAT
jgi:LysR family transcriptional regulator for metE and metH